MAYIWAIIVFIVITADEDIEKLVKEKEGVKYDNSVI